MATFPEHNGKTFVNNKWIQIDEVFPYGIHSPSSTIEHHQDKWRWLVNELNLSYGEDWMLRIPEESSFYDVWCFKDEGNAIAFCLKWL
jgi:hypothetical protein